MDVPTALSEVVNSLATRVVAVVANCTSDFIGWTPKTVNKAKYRLSDWVKCRHSDRTGWNICTRIGLGEISALRSDWVKYLHSDRTGWNICTQIGLGEISALRSDWVKYRRSDRTGWNICTQIGLGEISALRSDWVKSPLPWCVCVITIQLQGAEASDFFVV
jgi:hypothetical protein